MCVASSYTMLSDFIIGKYTTIEITIGIPRVIPLQVYRSALAYPPSDMSKFAHVITLPIDGKSYENTQFGDIAMTLIYHAGLRDELVTKKFSFDIDDILCDLPGMLAVISWAKIMLVPSATYNNYVAAVVDGVTECARQIRAYVCESVKLFGSRHDYIKYARSIGIRIPDTTSDYIILPAMRAEGDRVWASFNEVTTKHHDKHYIIYAREPRIGTNGIFPYCPEEWKNITGADLARAQDRNLFEIVKRELEILNLRDPHYMMIDNFDDECEELLSELIGKHDVKLHCKAHPDMTIFDVFRYGLSKALSDCSDSD